MFQDLGKIFIFLGFIFLIVGLILSYFKFLPFGKLPGDISWEKGNTRFYFPFVSSILISILLTIILNIIFWFLKRK